MEGPRQSHVRERKLIQPQQLISYERGVGRPWSSFCHVSREVAWQGWHITDRHSPTHTAKEGMGKAVTKMFRDLDQVRFEVGGVSDRMSSTQLTLVPHAHLLRTHARTGPAMRKA